MGSLDYVVLAGYFVLMILLGVVSSLRIKHQEDYFMGGRGFGKLLQTFAAFGAGTGSSDPVNTAGTTFTSGMSGMWSVMYWLFVTPFYWITGVWYRRMRHLTLGDWFVERYESRALGAGYCLFGFGFFAVYGSMMFSAIGKVAAPLVEADAFALGGNQYPIEYLLVPIIGVVVLVYGIMGGLRAAYFTDLVQGLCIIFLSIVLIPYGLWALVERFGDPETQSLLAGFRILHRQLPAEYFTVLGTSASEFPLHRIAAVVVINLIGVVVQPHFIATGGGSAKTENTARVGLVVGNLLKRICTVGWVLTALIALALFADSEELLGDRDKTWGVASRELLGPGLTGLMLACLLAALMSSIDAYMIVGSALFVRNVYQPYFRPKAGEQECLWIGRLSGVFVVGSAVVISLWYINVFHHLPVTLMFGVLFAAPFWIGMYWRGATKTAAWCAVAFCALMFFVVPFAAPRLFPALTTSPMFTTVSDIVVTRSERPAAPTDLARRRTEIAAWERKNAAIGLLESEPERQTARDLLGPRPAELQEGDPLATETRIGGQPIFFPAGVTPIDELGKTLNIKPQPVGEPEQVDEHTTRQVLRYPEGTRLRGSGNLQLDFLLFQAAGIDLRTLSPATLSTLELLPKIASPFLVMILISLFTPKNSQASLDRYYAKMKTPVDPDPQADREKLQAAYANPAGLESLKLFPGTSLEFQRPRTADVLGVIIVTAACFGVIGLAVLVVNLGR